MQSHGTCYVAYGGLEHSKRVYQVLVHSSCATDFVWIDASSGEIPTGAVQGISQLNDFLILSEFLIYKKNDSRWG